MSFNTQLSNYFVNSQANNVATYFNSGYLFIYDGPQPANANLPATGNLLVALNFSNPAFAPAVNGVLTAYALTSNVATATGTASWFRTTQNDMTTVLLDGSVGSAAGNNLVLGTTYISTGSVVSITGFTHTVAESTPGA